MTNYNTTLEAARFLAKQAIQGMTQATSINNVTFAESNWTGDEAVDCYATVGDGEEATKAASVEGALQEAAERVQAWLDRGNGFQIDVQRFLDDSHHRIGRHYCIVETVDTIGRAGETHFIAWVDFYGEIVLGVALNSARGTISVVSEGLEILEKNDEDQGYVPPDRNRIGKAVRKMFKLYEQHTKKQLAA